MSGSVTRDNYKEVVNTCLNTLELQIKVTKEYEYLVLLLFACRGEPVCSPGIALRMHQPYCSGLANPAPTFPLTVKYSHQTLVTADVPSAVIECQRPSTVILTVPTIKHYLCYE